MTDTSAFGWIHEGRTSEACRRATVSALRCCLPYLVLVLLVLPSACIMKAEAAPAIAAADRSYALPVLALALVAIGLVVGCIIGRALHARKTARERVYCRVCSLLNGGPGTVPHDRPARRVRAGGVPPAPYSYSSDHPELTLAEQRRRRQADQELQAALAKLPVRRR